MDARGTSLVPRQQPIAGVHEFRQTRVRLRAETTYPAKILISECRAYLLPTVTFLERRICWAMNGVADELSS